MRLVVVEYVSLDGVVQAPGDTSEDPEGGFMHGGWTAPFMAEHRRYNTEVFPTAGGFLMGRRTYEIFAAYWPTVTDESDEIARALNTRPKYVVSATLEDTDWKATVLLKGGVCGRGRDAEGTARPAGPRRRELRTRSDPHPARPRRRVPAVAASSRARRGQTALQGRQSRRWAGPVGQQDDGNRPRHPHWG